MSNEITIDSVVQFRFEPGTGGVVVALDGALARVRTPAGEREVPISGLRHVRPEHEQRVRASSS